jgi:fucose 4-O-acetylase-like acetyltransferase
MRSCTRVAQIVLTTDAAFLIWYGALSLFFTPGSVDEPYLSTGRVFYGVLPAVLGLGSAVCAVWLGFAQTPQTDRSGSA